MSSSLVARFDAACLSVPSLMSASIQAGCEVRAVCVQVDVSYKGLSPWCDDHVDAPTMGSHGVVIYARPCDGPTVVLESALREFRAAVTIVCPEVFDVKAVALPLGIPFEADAVKRFLGCFKADDVDTQVRRIPSLLVTDDRVHRVSFDAEAWFLCADDRAISALASCGFGGDYAADAVGHWMSEFRDDVAGALNHCCRVSPGFEVHVDVTHAVMWLAEHRPHLVPPDEDDACGPTDDSVTTEPAVS